MKQITRPTHTEDFRLETSREILYRNRVGMCQLTSSLIPCLSSSLPPSSSKERAEGVSCQNKILWEEKGKRETENSSRLWQ